jgi:hypothetical protein
MLRWFNRNKAPKELKNAVGLSEEALELLNEDLSKLAKIKNDLPARALAYVPHCGRRCRLPEM